MNGYFPSCGIYNSVTIENNEFIKKKFEVEVFLK